MKHIIDAQFFPGFTRKSITFTIDDGNTRLDRKFLNIVKPAGLRGTFNLCSHNISQLSPAEYRAFYDGFEIANHVRLHPYAFSPNLTLPIKDEPFDPKTADPAFLYPADIPHFYRYRRPYGWVYVGDDVGYLSMVARGRAELETLFERPITGFVWPYGEQANPAVIEGVRASGCAYMRKTGCVKNSADFDMPADRMAWSYTANDGCMTETAAQYEAYPDDGKLKFYCFGVHSHDFENDGTWDVLIDFCDRYGNRPADFWYASVIDIFRYEDAVNALVVTDDTISNPSDVDLFLTVDGKRTTLRKHSILSLA